MSKDIDLDISTLIEKKFRDIKLETKLIAFAVRRDCNSIMSFKRNYFTIEPYQKIYDIIKTNKIIFPQDMLYKFVKKTIPEEEREIYKSYIEKIYDENLKNTDRKTIDRFAHDLKALHDSRTLMKTMSDVLNNMDKFDIIRAKRMFRDAITGESSLGLKHRGEYLEDFEERYEEQQKKRSDPRKFSGIPTGIRKLDEISGGLQKGEFGIVVASTGVGKSLTLGNFAVNAWKRNYNVVFVSLEMEKHSLQYRFDSRIAKIDHSKFRKAKLEDSEFESWKKRMVSLRDKRKNFLEVVCMPRKCCAAEIEDEMLKIQAIRKQDVDLLIVDYLNIMSSNDGKQDTKRWDIQAEIAWNLKELSLGYNGTGIPIWTANQLTDDGNEAKKIETQHLKYSRGISEIAPVILALSSSIDDQLEDIMKLWVLKCRDFGRMKTPIVLHPKMNIMLIDSEMITLNNVGR